MQGPGPGRRLQPLVRQGSGASFGGQKRLSVVSGTSTAQALSCRGESTASNSRAGATGSVTANRYTQQVFDDEGKDVTPHPLLCLDQSPTEPRTLLDSSSSLRDTGSRAPSPLPVQQTPGGNVSVGLLCRTQGGRSSSVLKSPKAVPMLDGTAKPGSGWGRRGNSSAEKVRQKERTEELAEDNVDRTVDICLSETETLWILDMSSAVVSRESEEAGRVEERNRIYADVCKSRPGNERFVEKMMQTIHGATKNKEVQCDKITMEDKGSTTSIAISEGAVLARAQEEEECCSEAILTSESFRQHLFFMERILMENIFQPKLAAYRQLPVLIDPDVTSNDSDTEVDLIAVKQEEHDKEKDEEEQEEVFTDPPVPSDPNEDPEEMLPPTLEELWSYTCELTKGHSVSSMAWSRVNPDLLAVGYGAFDCKDQEKGLACCWSLKNPKWPERVFHCQHRITTLDFSLRNPQLLAVGMCDGSVALWNVQSWDQAALWGSGDSPNSLVGPVWQLRWVEQGRDAAGGEDKKETLLCVSADGRITEWFIQKRLDCTDLMKIKRTESEEKKLPSEKERKSEALLSRQAAGMCFDFHPKDTTFFLTGTEEGNIHLCSSLCSEKFIKIYRGRKDTNSFVTGTEEDDIHLSSSCNEKIIKTYRGHKGPVYKVVWSPFSTDMFLSCSADWTIILWHQDSETPVLTFSSTAAFVHDIAWSPKSASVFAAVNDSRAEIWDLSVSSLNPTISCFASPGVSFTSVLFAKNTNCLLVGDSKGEVGVFELQNLAAPSEVGTLEDVIDPAVAPCLAGKQQERFTVTLT